MIKNIFESIEDKHVLISFIVILIIVFTLVLKWKQIEKWCPWHWWREQDAKIAAARKKYWIR